MRSECRGSRCRLDGTIVTLAAGSSAAGGLGLPPLEADGTERVPLIRGETRPETLLNLGDDPWGSLVMAPFMVEASFSPETDLRLMNSVIAKEVAQVRVLTREGRLGSVHISPARGRVFLEVHADEAGSVSATVETLPMAKWWTIDLYPTMGPPDRRD